MKKIMAAVLISGFAISVSMAQGADSLQTDSLDLKIGQMIMIGLGNFNKLDTNAVVFESIRTGKAGGIILFEKNLTSKNTEESLRNILDYAQKQSEIPVFVSIDEEGGRVNRLKTKYGFPKTVTAEYLGTLDDLDSTSFYASKTAATLRKLGINMNFAPSVDVNINPENPVIGKIGRSYSPDHHTVAAHAQQVVEAHDIYGVATVIKHFPGHGSSQNDSHLGMADVSTTWRFEELYPYKALIDSGKVRAIMTAHIVNATLDEEKLPATLSERVIGGVLREFLAYDGVVISDDMQMKAISAEYGLEEAVKKCVQAGVDILLFANNVPNHELVTAEEIHQIIKTLVENGEVDRDRINESYQRIIKLKTTLDN